jgi:hypothetical protein
MSHGTFEDQASAEASRAKEDLPKGDSSKRDLSKGDLSGAIARSIERQFDEQLRVVRVFANYYRCNWWVLDPSPHPFWLRTGTIRRSRFLRARMKDDKLLIDGDTSPVLAIVDGTIPEPS